MYILHMPCLTSRCGIPSAWICPGPIVMQPVREAVSYRELFTAGRFGVREKYCFRLKIYDRLRASEQADGLPRLLSQLWPP